MNKMLKVAAVMVAGAVATLASTTARADDSDLSLKLDPGLAVPLAQPQASGVGAGASVNAKLWVGAGPYFSFGPSASITVLGSNPGVESSQTTVGAGWAFMLRRPLNNNDASTLYASPWVDADFQINKAGNAGETVPSVSAGAGVSFPLTVDRSVWVGPFVRFQNVFSIPGNTGGFDNQNNALGIMGLSFEFGPSHLPPVVKPVVVEVVQPPPAPPAPVVVEATPAPVVAEAPFVIDQKIQFAFDSANLLPGSSDMLDTIAQSIQNHQNYSVTVRGYASSEGDINYNNQLSLRRAQTVANYLVSRHVDIERLTAEGMGISNPVADNSTEAGRQLNRRVDFVTVVVTFTGTK
jgi:outer membrane protein OmpA-like peptidoglycan-associated protein